MEPKIVFVSKSKIDVGNQGIQQMDEIADADEADIIILDIDSMDQTDMKRIKREKDIVLMTQELTEENISKMITYCMEDIKKDYSYKWNGRKKMLNLDDIIYFESVHRIIKAYKENGEYVQFYKKLDDLQQEIQNLKMFIRPNQSHLVNLKYCKFEKQFVIVGEKRIHITRKYKESMEKYR